VDCFEGSQQIFSLWRIKGRGVRLGSYRTEFYPTCDDKAVGIATHDKAQ
jgi:hypothetical protein